MSAVVRMPHWLRGRLKREAHKLAQASGISRAMGEGYRVFVRFDYGRQTFVFSFRSDDEVVSAGVEPGWFELR